VITYPASGARFRFWFESTGKSRPFTVIRVLRGLLESGRCKSEWVGAALGSFRAVEAILCVAHDVTARLGYDCIE
jgi:hypothetical protein